MVFFNRVYPPERGATGRILRDLARAFTRDGWDVTVVSSGPRARRGKDGGVDVTIVRARFRPGSLLGYLYIWLRLLAAGFTLKRHDLVVTMTDPPLLVVVGRWLAAIKKSRHIHWCQDVYPDLLPVLGMHVSPRILEYLKTLARRAMRKCDRVIVIGRCMARYITHSGIEPRRVVTIANWAETALHHKPSAAPPAVLRGVKDRGPALTGGPPKFRLLYSGNLGRAHPVRAILAAATVLNKTNPDIEFLFVGDGRQFDRLVAERDRRGLNNMRFLPYQPAGNVRAVLESGDMHLISMQDRALGLLVPCKFYAALAVGRPCIFIGPATAEPARILQDYGAGAVVPPNQPKMLVDIIRQYRQNGEQWQAAHQAAVRAGRDIKPRDSMQAWIDLARDVIGIRKKG